MIDYSIVYPSTHNPSWVVFMNYNYYCIDKVFYGIKYLNDEYLCAFMNSTICVFQSEFFGYSLVSGGGSFITVEDLKKLLIIDKIKEKKLIEIFKDLKSRKYYTIFTEIGIDPSKSIRSQKPNPLPDRKALDDIIFDILGLTQEERNEVYWAVCELVKNRLEKAKSV
jgi:hypothetical protein